MGRIDVLTFTTNIKTFNRIILIEQIKYWMPMTVERHFLYQ